LTYIALSDGFSNPYPTPAKDCLGSLPYHQLALMVPRRHPGLTPPPFQAAALVQGTSELGTFRAVPGRLFAFDRNPTKFSGTEAPYFSSRPNSFNEVPSFECLSESFDRQIHTPSIVSPATTGSTVFQDTSSLLYMRPTLLGSTSFQQDPAPFRQAVRTWCKPRTPAALFTLAFPSVPC